MPRKYVKKRKSSYSVDDINHALSDIQEEKLTIISAAHQYNVPITTL